MKQGAIVHEVPPEMIMQWMDSESAPDETAAVASHVRGCAECRTMMAELRKGSARLAAWEVPDSGQARLELDRLRSRTEKQAGSVVASLLRPGYAAALCALLLALTWWAQLSPSRIHVDEQTVRAKLIKTLAPIPQYPEEARKNNLQGRVILHLVVARNGTVKQLDVVQGDRVLARAAVEGVRKWKFRPTVVDGKTVEVESEIQVDFTLLP
jgi:TonB family protein